MPTKKSVKIKKDVRSQLRKKLGTKTANAMLKKIDEMARKGASARTIQKAIAKDLANLKKAVEEIIEIIWEG